MKITTRFNSMMLLKRIYTLGILFFFALPCNLFATIEILSVTPISSPCSGAISIVATGSAGPFTFEWTGPNNFTSTAEDINGLCNPGIYEVKVVFPNGGCFATLSATVVQCENIQGNGEITKLCSATSNDAAIDISVSGGIAPYLFSWSNGATTEDLLNIGAGQYCLTITDNYGCKSLEECYSPAIFEAVTISLSADPASPNCVGSGTIAVVINNGKAPFDITWSSGAVNTNSIYVSSTNLYSVTVTDACNVSRVASIYYQVSRNLSLSNTKNCDIFGIDLSVSGGTEPFVYSWSWSGNASWFRSTEDLVNIPPVGIYKVTVTDNLGCTVTTSVTGTPPMILSGTTTDPSFGNCSDGAININISGGSAPYDYEWMGPDGFSSYNMNIANIKPGQYCITVTDANSCTITSCFSVEPTLVGIKYIQNVNYCSGDGSSQCSGSIQLDITGVSVPLTFNWSGPFGFHSSSKDLQNLCPGTYNLVVVGPSGCYQNLTVTICCCTFISTGGTNYSCSGVINQPAPPISSIEVANMVAPSLPNLFTGSINISVTGGSGIYYYSWTGPNGFQSFEQNLTNISTGTYCVTVKDGCSEKTKCIELKACSTFNISGWTQENCTGFTAGKVNLTVSGGNDPISYLWNTGVTTKNLLNLSAGTYTVTATDFAGCTKTSSFTIGTIAPNISNQSNPCRKVFSCNGTTIYENADPSPPVWDGCNRAKVYCSLTGALIQTINVPFGSDPINNILIDPSDCTLYCQQSNNVTNTGTYMQSYAVYDKNKPNICSIGPGCLFENIIINGSFRELYFIPTGTLTQYPVTFATVYDCEGMPSWCRKIKKCQNFEVEEIQGCHSCAAVALQKNDNNIVDTLKIISDNISLVDYLYLISESDTSIKYFGIDSQFELFVSLKEYEEYHAKNQIFVLKSFSREEVRAAYLSQIADNTLLLNAYPNPFTDEIKIIIKGEENEVFYVTIFDVLGTSVQSFTISPDQRFQSTVLDTKLLAPGTYKLCVRSNKSVDYLNVIKISPK